MGTPVKPPASGSTTRRLLRDIYRLFTYSPWVTLREHQRLIAALRHWHGQHLFLFPYFGIGGAERVHADIVASVKDKSPLVIINGFSSSDANRSAFERSAMMLDLPRLLNHPFTRRYARQRIAAALNGRTHPVLFASLSTFFFDLLPTLKANVRCFYLQHAFLFQPNGNAQHKQWLPFFPRLQGMLFVSGQALREYDRFLGAHNIPAAQRSKLQLIPNAVHHFGTVNVHDRIGVLFVGRDSEEKRLDLFLAIAQQVQRNKPGAFHFTVVGPQKREVGGVTFTGPVTDDSELRTIYNAHDVLLVTSHREGFPMVIMEAMAQGLAIMSTPVGDVPERLDQDVAHITSTIEASAVVTEMTAWLIDLDSDRSVLGIKRKTALAQAQREFGMEAFVERYRALLTSPDAST